MNTAAATPGKWYDKSWLVILLCLFIFPVGLYGLWKSKRIGMGWKIAVSVFFGLIIIAALTGDSSQKSASSSTSSATPAKAKQPLTWKIITTDSAATGIQFRITINDRTDDKEQLIEIARKLKEERNWTENMTCFFDIKVPSHTFAWASCSYLPQCPACPTDKDSDGNPVEYKLIGMTKKLADSLQILKLDSIPNKTPVASYLEDVASCKTILYQVDNNPNKLLQAQLFNDGGHIVQWLSMKKVNEQTRYYYPGDDDEDVYLVIDENANTVNFFNGKGEWWQSVPILR